MYIYIFLILTHNFYYECFMYILNLTIDFFVLKM